ncbi:MAG: NUDIX hydrolase [Thermacetogeniaceae bacterium]
MIDKVAYDGWLKVHKRQIGNKTYDILKDYDAVAALIMNEYGEVLLVKQFRPSIMRDALEIPAGTMDLEGESETECLARELKEEAHLAILPEDLQPLISYKPNLGFSNSDMHIYLAKIGKNRVVNEKPPDDEDINEIVWIKFNELERYIMDGKIQDIKTIIVYLYIKAHRLL